MDRGHSGFTIIELMVVITIIVIIALIAVPNLISGRLIANETSTMQTMRSIATAQSQFRQSGKADEDLDGQGEYGGFGELSGTRGVRGGLAKVPTDLTASMTQFNVHGEVSRSGYIYRMYLPDALGEGVREPAGGGYGPGVVDTDMSEVLWICYAWPVRYGVTGYRTFCTSHTGDITFTDEPIYSGEGCIDIQAGIAFLTPNVDSMTGRAAVGTIGADGRMWRMAQ
jgi:prepilin-type N-terminal cleavage/methylation domain-containing protein